MPRLNRHRRPVTKSLRALESEAWQLRHQQDRVAEERRRLLMERIRTIVTPHLISEAEFGAMAEPLAETLTVDPDRATKVQELHRQFAFVLIRDRRTRGSLEPAHVRILNLLREMLTVSYLQPLDLEPAKRPADMGATR